MLVEIRELEKIKLKNPVVIEGFPGVGMIGTISASYLAEKLDMKLIGCISSTHFPPISAIHDYKPVYPARIYASEEYNLILLFSEFVIPAQVVFSLTSAILKFAKAKKASAIYSLAGIATDQPGDKFYGIASNQKMADLLKKNGVELIKEGATQGVSGVLIAECASQNFPAANIMVQTASPLDPLASAKLLDKLAQIIEFKVNTSELSKQGEKVEARMKDAMDKMKSLHADYQKMEANPMYG